MKRNLYANIKIIRHSKYGENLEVEPKARRKDRPKLPDVDSVKGRKFWYSIPQLDLPSILFPMWFRYKYRAFLNEAKTHGHSYWYYVITDKEYEKPLTAYLNATITQFLLEIFGRQYSGMLHMKVYELKLLPVLDPDQLNTQQRKRLSALFDELSEAIQRRMEVEEKYQVVKSKHPAQQGLFESEIKKALEQAIDNEGKVRRELDNTIYAILDLDKEDIIQIEYGLKHLRELRKMRTKGRR